MRKEASDTEFWGERIVGNREVSEADSLSLPFLYFLFLSRTADLSFHHAGVSHKDDRKYPRASGSADIPSGDNARGR